jgi:hypothetical protein
MSLASPSDNLEAERYGVPYSFESRPIESEQQLDVSQSQHAKRLVLHSRRKTFVSLPDEMLVQIIDLLDSKSLRRLCRKSGHLRGLVALKMLRRVECVEREMMRAKISDTYRFQERPEKFGVQSGRDMKAQRMSLRHFIQKLAALV